MLALPMSEHTMKIWVDADACPTNIREILCRAAQRTETVVTLVSNHVIRTPSSPFVKSLQVAKGFDVADHEIVRRAQAGDLIITSDIPLAAEVVALGCHALSPRGELFTKENVRARLNMRDFLDTLRASGTHTGGPASMSAAEQRQFANTLDRLLRQAADRGR